MTFRGLSLAESSVIPWQRHGLTGLRQSMAHIQRRVDAVAAAKDRWTSERHAQWRQRIAEANERRDPAIRRKFMYSNVGRTPWNKGNDWRDALTPEEVRAIGAKRARSRRARNPGRRVHERITALVRQAIKGQKAGRPWETLVGYSREDLMCHLEARFQPGMTWQNMGDWHIDHIIPRAVFSFASPDDPGFRDCWALSNLQPLWAADN